MLKKLTYNDNGELVGQHECEYDENGQCVKISASSTYEYEYDNMGRCIKRTEISGKEKNSYSYAYDDNGNCIQEDIEYDDGENVHRTFTYDEDGMYISSSDGQEVKYILTYREHELSTPYSDPEQKLIEELNDISPYKS